MRQGGGILQTIRDGLNTAAATISAPFVTPEMVPYTVDRNVTADDNTVRYFDRVAGRRSAFDRKRNG